MTTSQPSETAPRFTWTAGFMGPLLIALVLALGVANVVTVLSSTFHDLVFSIAERALFIFGAEAAERMTHKSLRRQAENRTRVATAELRDENHALKTRNEQLGLRNAELDAKRTKALADSDALKAAHAKTHAELGELKLNRAREVKHAKEMATSVRARLAKGVVRNNAAIPAEAIPYIGIGVTLSVTALDIYDACQTMKEINELMRLMGQGEENADFCGVRTPTVPQVLAKMQTEWQASVESVAKEAKGLAAGVPVPEVRLPSPAEARAVICPLVGSMSWTGC